MKIFKYLVAALLLATPAYAQKTKAELNAEIATSFPNNNSGTITPSVLRKVTGDIVSAIMPTAPVVAGNLACFNGVTGLLKDCGTSPISNPLVVGTTPITSGATNGLLYNNSSVLGNLATANNGVLVTNGTGIPFISTTLPSGLVLPGYALLSANNTWTGLNTFTNATGVAVNGMVRVETPSSAFPTSDLGPGGLNWITFSNTATYSYVHAFFPGNQNYLKSANATIVNTPGSGTFGPAAADVAHLFSVKKDNYLTSTLEGEIDTVIVIASQGLFGDVGGYVADVTKVKGATGTGGAGAAELAARYVDSSGNVLNSVHFLPSFMESQAGVSGGNGYGAYVDSWNGVNYAGYYVGSFLGNSSTTGWNYAFIAAGDRTLGAQYFRVVGDRVGGALKPGDIIQGFTGQTKTIRTEGGTLKVRNTADTTTLLSVTDAGVASLNQLSIAGAQIGGANFTLHTIADQNIYVFGNVNSGAAINGINDAGNAFAPLTVGGSSLFFQTGGSNKMSLYPSGGLVLGASLPADPGADNFAAAGKIIAASTLKHGVSTVAILPTCNAGAEGTRSGVTDANATTFLSVVAGGGSNHVPVYCNGTAWVIG